MYTDEMAKAFHSIKPPKNFSVILMDFDHFISVQVDPRQLVDKLDTEVQDIVRYITEVKESLESFGTLVNISRET